MELSEINSTLNTEFSKLTKSNNRKTSLSLGPSSSPISSDCLRQKYYQIHNYPSCDRDYKSSNTLELGGLAEQVITNRLKEFGFKLSHILDEQQKFVFGMRITGFSDGVIESIKGTVLETILGSESRLLLEMKTSNSKNWQVLKNHGVIKEKYGHYLQMQSYMYKMFQMEEYKDIEYALYVSLNKDTSELYFEIVPRDIEIGKRNIEHLKALIQLDHFPKAKRSYLCNWCDYCDTCQRNLKFKICNKCRYITVNEDGSVTCAKGNNPKWETEEETNCKDFEYPLDSEPEVKQTDNNFSELFSGIFGNS